MNKEQEQLKEQLEQIIRLALLVAAQPPKEPTGPAYDAKVKWETIQELRAALEAAGYKWTRVWNVLHPPKKR